MNMPRFAGHAAQYRKRRGGSGLNLVSLMDIFTILVFFLLVNSSSVQQMPNSKSVKLPHSTSDRLPEETLLLLVNEEHVLVQGRPVVKVADIVGDEGLLITPLLEELKHHAARRALQQDEAGNTIPGEVTILGDRAIDYSLLKRIVATCSQANYGTISLAVMRKAKEKG